MLGRTASVIFFHMVFVHSTAQKVKFWGVVGHHIQIAKRGSKFCELGTAYFRLGLQCVFIGFLLLAREAIGRIAVFAGFLRHERIAHVMPKAS